MVDTSVLYHGDDPGYELWLGIVTDRVNQTRRAQRAAEEKAAKGK